MGTKPDFIGASELSMCWSDWRKGLKESVESSRDYYQDETVRLLVDKLNKFLDRKVCDSSEKEEIIDAMWEAANEAERKTLAQLLLKIADRL